MELLWPSKTSPPTSDCWVEQQAPWSQVSNITYLGTIPALCYLKLTPRPMSDIRCIAVAVLYSIMTICGFVGAFAAVFAVNWCIWVLNIMDTINPIWLAESNWTCCLQAMLPQLGHILLPWMNHSCRLVWRLNHFYWRKAHQFWCWAALQSHLQGHKLMRNLMLFC